MMKTQSIHGVEKIFHGSNSVSREFSKHLEYPVDLDELDLWVSKENPFGILSVLDGVTSYQFKAWLKPLRLDELEEVHRYFNTIRCFRRARTVFHEILRRQVRMKRLLTKHGTKRALGARLLLGQIRFGGEKKSVLHNSVLPFFMLICHPGKSPDFRSLIAGKTVSLVGGGRENDIALEVDSSDLVARLNKYELTCEQMKDVGSKIDIVFLRGEISQYLFTEKGKNALSSFRDVFFSIKLKSLYKSFNVNKKNWCFSTDNAFSYALLNGVQAAVFDLVYNKVNKICIYGVNFNLDAGHLPGYRPDSMAAVEFDLIFGAHPPHAQFLITKFFVCQGFVVAGGRFKNLLNLNYRQFSRVFDGQCGTEK